MLSPMNSCSDTRDRQATRREMLARLATKPMLLTDGSNSLAAPCNHSNCNNVTKTSSNLCHAACVTFFSALCASSSFSLCCPASLCCPTYKHASRCYRNMHDSHCILTARSRDDTLCLGGTCNLRNLRNLLTTFCRCNILAASSRQREQDKQDSSSCWRDARLWLLEQCSQHARARHLMS